MNLQTQLHIDLDPKEVRAFVEKRIDEEVTNAIVLCDLNRLSQVLCMSKRFLEARFLHDARVKVHERRYVNKRFWIYKPTIEAILKIVDEW